jgi:maltose-binding protein MalE
MVKKVFFLFLLFLFACNAGKRHEAEISINVPANANLLKTLKNQLQQFEQRHQINIKLIPFTGQEKLYAMMAANQEPDVFYTNTVVRDQLAAEGRLLNLFTFVEGDSFIKKIRPEFIERGTSLDGGWYQFCDWTYTLGVYYNRSLFDLHNVPYPDSNWTWKEMLRRTKELTLDIDGDNKIDQYGIYIAEHFVSAIERMNGADYSPNPVLKDINFVKSWQEKYSRLKNTNFGQVWRLSEKYDGGDIRDFVRYSSWSSATILETLAPQMDKLFANKVSIEQIEKMEEDINKRVIEELKIMVSNENLRPAFREKIRDELNKSSAIGS